MGLMDVSGQCPKECVEVRYSFFVNVNIVGLLIYVEV